MSSKNNEQESLARAAQLARYVEVLDVFLTKSQAETNSRELLLTSENRKVRFEKTSTIKYRPDDRILSVVASFDLCVEAAEEEEGEPPDPQLLTVAGTYELQYLYLAEGGPEGEELEAYFQSFAEYNGVYNAWPYFREFVQNITMRMGVPPLVLPVYRLPKQPAPAGPDGDESASV